MRKLQKTSPTLSRTWTELVPVSMTALSPWCTGHSPALHSGFAFALVSAGAGTATCSGCDVLRRDGSTEKQAASISRGQQPMQPPFTSTSLHSQTAQKHKLDSYPWKTLHECSCGHLKQTSNTLRSAIMSFFEHFYQSCPSCLPSSGTLKCSVGFIETMLTWDLSSWKISFSCSLLLSQSTKISNSEFRLLDFRDSMCTRFTCFSCFVRKQCFQTDWLKLID